MLRICALFILKMKTLVVVCFAFFGLDCDAMRIIWDKNSSFKENMVTFGRGDHVRMPNWFFIYPGTKWCGAGDIAENYDDLGEFVDTDKCCRAHDLCDDVIEGYQTRHNLTNPNFYSRLNCVCDDDFRKCLKTVDSRVSTQIGHIYFTGLSTKCFKEEYPIIECIRNSYLPRKKCIAYELDTSMDKVYQWFDLPNF